MVPKLNPGEVIVLEGRAKWWQLHLKLVQAVIRHYQKDKWGRNYRGTHVMLAVNDSREYPYRMQLFEQAYPRAKFTDLRDIQDATYAVCMWKHNTSEFTCSLNDCLMDGCKDYLGKGYDIGDLADFAFSGWALGLWNRVIRILGAKGFGVCSTVVARILKRCGYYSTDAPFDPDTIDPAFFENSVDWFIKYRVRKGRIQWSTDY